MDIRSQNFFNALCFSTQTNIEGLFKYVRVKAHELYNDACENKLEISGPVYWIYTGMDGQPDTIFNLDIVIPIINASGYKGKFKIKKVETIKYLSLVHFDKWEKLPETYGKLFVELGQKNYNPSGICREVYIHMDFENPENNITEVQVGIQ